MGAGAMRPFSVRLSILISVGLVGIAHAESPPEPQALGAYKATRGPSEDANIAELRRLLQQPEGSIDLAEAKVIIDRMVDPAVDVRRTIDELDQWTDKVRARFPPGASNKTKLDLLISTLYEPGPWNDNRPFGYDFSDPQISGIGGTLLPNYLAKRKGQCVIMPITFVLLGQRLELPVTMTMAPYHLLVKYGDEEISAWTNVEATSGRIYPDSGYERSPVLNMPTEGITHGTFLRPFTQRESVAVFATTTLAPYYRSRNQPERLLQVTDLILEANPKDAVAMTFRGDAYYQLVEQRFKRKYPLASQIPPRLQADLWFLSHQNMLWYATAEALGWREWSQEQWARYEKHFLKQQMTSQAGGAL